MNTNKHKKQVCPICRTEYTGYPAISRKDNKTYICPDCGVQEALMSFVLHKNRSEG